MSYSLAWLYLILAVLSEVAGTISMKLAVGFTLLLPSILIFICYAFSLFFLTLSLQVFGIGFAYAVWSALGTILIYLISFTYFAETITLLKSISLILIIVGMAGLKQE